jgi:chromate reductase
MKILLFSGSLRKASLNRKLLAVVASKLKKSGEEAHVLDLAELHFPVYNFEIEEKGIPDTVKKMAQAIGDAEALLICSPEYNGGMSGVLKNALDWVSRIRPMPWKNKPLLLMAASPGALGGTRGLWHGRVPFEVAGCFFYPDMFALPKADEAFDEAGDLKDKKTDERIDDILQSYLNFAKNTSKLT